MAGINVESPVLEVDDYSDLTDRVPAVDSDEEIVREGFRIYVSPGSLAGAEKRAENLAQGYGKKGRSEVTRRKFRQALQLQTGQ